MNFYTSCTNENGNESSTFYFLSVRNQLMKSYDEHLQNTDELRQRLVTTWKDLDTAVDQWQFRLTVCDRAKGEHFEQNL